MAIPKAPQAGQHTLIPAATVNDDRAADEHRAPVVLGPAEFLLAHRLVSAVRRTDGQGADQVYAQLADADAVQPVLAIVLGALWQALEQACGGERAARRVVLDVLAAIEARERSRA